MADDELPFRYIPPPDPNLGRRVDTYFILRVLLGKGGMGAAYLAEHEALAHIKCVIKLVLVEMTRHPMIISRYHNEAKALALLKHDNIVKLHGLGVLDDGQLYLRFEYVEGKSLDRYLAEHGGRLPLRKAVNFIFQLCWALQHAHDRGVIHRDLKPDNMMIEVDSPGSHVKERVKILDFGIAKVVSGGADVTGSGMQMGTPTYMAPEQVTNAAGVDGRADVFSLAQVLYKMVTGGLPWGSPESSVEIYHRQRTQPPVWPAADLMPPEVVELVFRALSISADDRPTAHEFAIELASRIKNGTDLLAKVVPDWAASTPPHATTLPRPAEPTPPALRSPIADAPGLGGSGTPPPLNVASLSPEAAARQPVKNITAPSRPRALATPSAPMPVAARRSPGAALNTPVTPPLTPLVTPPLPPFSAGHQRPPTPVLAALPTGLASQQFAAQEPPVEMRVPQAEIASEIEMATGTPGPLPYAHAELPAVLVSQTQLSGLTSQASAPGVSPPDHREPPPFVMLPSASKAAAQRARSVRGKLVLLGAACALAAVGAFAISRLGPDTTTVEEQRSATIPSDGRSPRTVVVVAPDAGVADSSPKPAALARRDILGIVGSSSWEVADADVRPDANAVGQVANSAAHRKSATAPTEEASVAPPSGTTQTLPIRSTPPGAGVESPKAAEPTTAKPQRGRLTIHVDPFADVWIDGRFVRTTPIENLSLPVGTHHVRLVNEPGRHDETSVVTIDAAKSVLIEKNW
jgi:serine/threonine-protein kinase